MHVIIITHLFSTQHFFFQMYHIFPENKKKYEELIEQDVIKRYW